MKTRVIIQFEPEVAERIQVFARDTGVSVSEVVRIAVDHGIEQTEVDVTSRPEVVAFLRDREADAKRIAALSQKAQHLVAMAESVQRKPKAKD